MSNPKDSKRGAIEFINSSEDYGVWTVETSEFIADPEVEGVWMVADRQKGFALLMNVLEKDEPFEVELECFDRNAAKHGKA